MKVYKLLIIYIFLTIFLCGCENNNRTQDNTDNLSRDISSNSDRIKELEVQINSLNVEIQDLNDKLKMNDGYEEKYSELKDKYDKISSENKDLKNKISNINSLVNGNKDTSGDIVYITFVAKGLLRISQISGSYYVYEGNVYNFPVNKNYTLGDQLPNFYKISGPRDSACDTTCWLKTINDTNCVNIQNFKTDSNIVLYSSCLNNTFENNN